MPSPPEVAPIQARHLPFTTKLQAHCEELGRRLCHQYELDRAAYEAELAELRSNNAQLCARIDALEANSETLSNQGIVLEVRGEEPVLGEHSSSCINGSSSEVKNNEDVKKEHINPISAKMNAIGDCSVKTVSNLVSGAAGSVADGALQASNLVTGAAGTALQASNLVAGAAGTVADGALQVHQTLNNKMIGMRLRKDETGLPVDNVLTDSFKSRSQEEQDLRRRFQQLDLDKKGFVEAIELQTWCPPLTDQVAMQQRLIHLERAIETLNLSLGYSRDDMDIHRLSCDAFVQLMTANQVAELVGEENADAVDEVRRMCIQGNMEIDVANAANILPVEITMNIDILNPSHKKHQLLEAFIATMILSNALIVGISLDRDPEWDGWAVFECVFCLIFSLELVLKVHWSGVLLHFFGDDWYWNWFDFLIVVIALIDVTFQVLYRFGNYKSGVDISKLTILRIARLLRITRLVKLLKLRFFKELTLMIKGIVGGLKTLLWAIILFVVQVYVLGVLMRQIAIEASKTTENCTQRNKFTDLEDLAGTLECHVVDARGDKIIEELFSSVPRSMFTVFRCFTDGCSSADGTPLMVWMWDYFGWGLVFVYVLVFLFVIFGLFNLIAAIFVENTLESARLDDQRRRQTRHTEHIRVAKRLQTLIGKLCTASRLEDIEEEGRQSVFQRLQSSVSRHSSRQAIEDQDAPTPDIMNTKVTKEVFEVVMTSTKVQDMLRDLDIAALSPEKLFDILDSDCNGTLSVTELIDGLMKMRGPADKGDAVAAALHTRSLQRNLAKFFNLLSESQHSLRERLVVIEEQIASLSWTPHRQSSGDFITVI